MTDPIPALLWQTDIDVLVACIEQRHATLSANFNQYVVSEAMMEKCASMLRTVNTYYIRDGNGLLQMLPETFAYYSQPMMAARRNNHHAH